MKIPKSEERVQLPIRVEKSLRRDIELTAKKESSTMTKVAETWLKAGRDAYKEQK